LSEKKDKALEASLIVKANDREIFSSHGKWLYPLFELEDFLAKNRYRTSELFLQDKIAGKAAAYLITRLGFVRVHIHLISQGALDVFSRHHVTASYDQVVPRIECKTEAIVRGDEDLDSVWQMLRRRAGRVDGLSLQIQNLTLNLDGKTILNQLQLQVGKGDHVFIRGANGTGKTTLLKAILGILPFNEGSIKVGDYFVGTAGWKRNRHLVGYVQQESTKNLFPVTAREVVEIGLSAQSLSRQEYEHRVDIAMRRTGCQHLGNASYHQLSGGEKQRVNLARCLCQQAKVLLLDEPTSYLDPEAKDELCALLNELWANEAPTVLIVSHDDRWIGKFTAPVYELKKGSICSSC